MILEDLWSGRFYPAEAVVPTSPEYREVNQEISKKMECLQAQLPPGAICPDRTTSRAARSIPLHGTGKSVLLRLCRWNATAVGSGVSAKKTAQRIRVVPPTLCGLI